MSMKTSTERQVTFRRLSVIRVKSEVDSLKSYMMCCGIFVLHINILKFEFEKTLK